MASAPSPRGGAAVVWGRRWGAAALLFCGLGTIVYRRLASGELLDGRDLARLDIPNASFLRSQLLRGELPFWIPSLHLGQPFLAIPETQALYPLRWLVLVLSPAAAITAEHLIALLTLAIGTAWAARRLGASRRSAATVAIAFSLGAMVTSLSVEQNILTALSWTGFILVGALALPRRPGRAAALIALPLALSWLAGAPEITICQSALAGAIALAPRSHRLRAIGTALFAILAGFGLAAPVTLPALALSQRLPPLFPAIALEWSAAWTDLLSLVWPGANLSHTDFAGAQHLVPMLLLGPLLVGAAAVGLWRGGRVTRSLGVLLLILVALSLGEHFPPAAWILVHAPGLRAFRFPVKYLIFGEWLLVVLAARGLDRITSMSRGLRRIGVAALCGAGVLLLLGGAAALVLPHLNNPDARPGLEIALLWLACSFGLILIVAYPGRPSARGRRVGFLLSVLVLLEALAFAGRPDSSSRSAIAGDQTLAERMHAQVGGWSRAAVGEAFDWDDLIDLLPTLASKPFDGRCGIFQRNRFTTAGFSSINADGPLDDMRVGLRWDRVKNQRSFRDLAGVAWVVTLPPAPDPDLVLFASCDEAPPGHQLSVYRSQTGMPRAFLVHAAERFTDEAEAVRWLGDPGEPFRSAALVREPPPLATCAGAEPVQISGDRPNQVAIEVTACAPGLLVVNEANDPGWTATLDGASIRVSDADLFLQAVAIPQGTHRVVLRYAPKSFRWGLVAALASALALYGFSRRKKP